MRNVLSTVDEETGRLTAYLLKTQQPDGSWRFCFENGIGIDAFVIILFRILEADPEGLIRQLHDRICKEQQPDGCWRLYPDEEEGSLSASVEAYYALLCSGYSRPEEEHMQRAKRYILSRGGIGKVDSILTKAILAATGQRPWPRSISMIPLEVLLFPSYFPINFFEFSGYSRVHLTPLLIMADRKFSVSPPDAPDLSDLASPRLDIDEDDPLPREYENLQAELRQGMNRLIGTPRFIHEAAVERAERFMLERIEPDGTLYSYASSTILMVLALLALGYEREHPVISDAVKGLTAMQCQADGTTTIQNSPSTVWDTALIADALQEAGVAENHPAIRQAASYLLSRQQDKPADWSLHNPDAAPGGWGFSESNTINPDVDDTTAALRAISRLTETDPLYQEAWNRGLNWVLSMQNRDGGWPAFEKDTDKHILTWLAIEGAKSAAIDPSEADLTGRTLEYLGHFAGLAQRHEFIRRGANWLIRHQEKDGSWYGRWGVCYIYGTWAALTGLAAAGVPASHDAIQKGVRWLEQIQNPDGGWGESCRSDRIMRYVPLGASTPSQTAWALDALIAVQEQPSPSVDRGVQRLTSLLQQDGGMTAYPTGAGLPGTFYSRYHSYRYIWPILTLSHYKRKYGHASLETPKPPDL
ncbi:squalene--hopene cyclase [Paenibacillus sp. AR247]|uniref:squalene--hopene cyclase n=1 Tax=Paenibacillus sp. AR247 TaxID=1631599 RepID=UPI000CF8ABF2|nr:squalene--hopene cyclase [Paenibacillus sp. AR247]PQP91268.1 squalene--hopene cyclase [Paenibacillus sp. AR247]